MERGASAQVELERAYAWAPRPTYKSGMNYPGFDYTQPQSLTRLFTCDCNIFYTSNKLIAVIRLLETWSCECLHKERVQLMLPGKAQRYQLKLRLVSAHNW